MNLSLFIMCSIYRSLRLHGFWIRLILEQNAILRIIEAASKHSPTADSIGLKTPKIILHSINFGNDEQQNNQVTASEAFLPLLDTVSA